MARLDINIKGITVLTHFDMIADYVIDGAAFAYNYLLKENGVHEMTKKVWGATYVVRFYLDPKTKTLIAECVR